MDVKFDKGTAVRLIQELDGCCSRMEKETQNLMKMLAQTDNWNDYQKQAFGRNITEIAKDLKQALKQEEDYMRTFYQRVQELGG